MLAATAAVLILFVGILAVPVTLQFDLHSDNRRRNDVNLQWAFGLVRLRIPTEKSGQQQDQKRRKKRSPGKRSTKKASNFFRVFRLRRLRRRVLRYLRDIWRAVHKDGVCARIRLGLDDPADTGQLWSVVGPIAGILAAIEQISVNIEPVFSEAVFEYETAGRIRIIPLQLLILTAALLVSPTVWGAMRQMREVGH